MAAKDTCYLTATEHKQLLASRRISAVELLEVHLDRVKRIDPTCNAMVALDGERALRQARAVDAKLGVARWSVGSMACR